MTSSVEMDLKMKAIKYAFEINGKRRVLQKLIWRTLHLKCITYYVYIVFYAKFCVYIDLKTGAV